MNKIEIDDVFVEASFKNIHLVEHNRFYSIRLQNVQQEIANHAKKIWPTIPFVRLGALSKKPGQISVVCGTIFKKRPKMPSIIDEVYSHTNSFAQVEKVSVSYLSPEDELYLEDDDNGKIKLILLEESGLKMDSVLFGCVLCVKGHLVIGSTCNEFQVEGYFYPPSLPPILPTKLNENSNVLKVPVIFVSNLGNALLPEEAKELSSCNREGTNAASSSTSSTSESSLTSSKTLQQQSIKQSLLNASKQATSSVSSKYNTNFIDLSKKPGVSKNKQKGKSKGSKSSTTTSSSSSSGSSSSCALDIRKYFAPINRKDDISEKEKPAATTTATTQAVLAPPEEILAPPLPAKLQALLKYLKSFVNGFEIIFLGGTFSKPFNLNNSIEILDILFHTILESNKNARVFLFPGSTDTTANAQSFPVRPFPDKMFKRSCKNLRFLSVTNPAQIGFENVMFLLIDKLFLMESSLQCCYKNPLTMAQHLLTLGNFAPIAPDTIAIKPGLDHDVFAIKRRPNFMVVAEQDLYEKMTIGNSSSNNDTCIVTVPNYNSSQSVVIIKENLDVIAAKINLDGNAEIDNLSEMDKLLQNAFDDVEDINNDDDDDNVFV